MLLDFVLLRLRRERSSGLRRGEAAVEALRVALSVSRLVELDVLELVRCRGWRALVALLVDEGRAERRWRGRGRGEEGLVGWRGRRGAGQEVALVGTCNRSRRHAHSGAAERLHESRAANLPDLCYPATDNELPAVLMEELAKPPSLARLRLSTRPETACCARTWNTHTSMEDRAARAGYRQYQKTPSRALLAVTVRQVQCPYLEGVRRLGPGSRRGTLRPWRRRPAGAPVGTSARKQSESPE